MTDLSDWLAREGLETVGLSSEVVGKFLATRRAAGRRVHVTPRVLGTARFWVI